MALEFDPAAYGGHFASVYDDVYADLSPDDAVRCLADLAGGGTVLEFGIGTGRIAIPLAAMGVAVEGIDASPQMVTQLRGKPGGADLRVEIGNFSSTVMGRRYALAVLAFNTINALPSQEAQVATFCNAAAHLEPAGAFVVENWVPDVAAFHRRRAVRVHEVGERQVLLDVAELRPAEQRMSTARLAFTGEGVRLLPMNHRYVWPAELDLMARLAGMHLEVRWEDWARRPFTDDSTTYVAVYRRGR
jgi:SAM-dependent methyltransferase